MRTLHTLHDINNSLTNTMERNYVYPKIVFLAALYQLQQPAVTSGHSALNTLKLQSYTQTPQL